ncbi:MAG: NADP-dependent isocitrate dehydrogenase [Alphaproteobacteria bacterium]|jgi:isocitrate dehydrogenase|nr:NADP-dependent isocitrate dehydrogenase [Alphaproteobacteria bacterium]MBT5828164.1 NADP-dependent isocitrate dehydrogenase [Alphaproteobacteria bacterium]
MKHSNHRITVAYGDGIGPEIMDSAVKILQSAEVNLAIDVISVGEEQYRRNFDSGIPPSAFDTIKNNKILLKAPITTPQGKGYKSLNVTLRKTLGLYANIRPVIAYDPYVKCNFPKMNLVIIRENEEDLYSGIEYRLTDENYEALKLISRTGSEKIAKFAFDYALKNKRKKVTCFIKDNIMKLTDGAFHTAYKEVAKNYPELENGQMIIDIATAKLAANPDLFDVIVTENLYGDIISDVAAEISGSVGLCGSANIGDKYAMFEAIHGSAPDIAGQNIANPTGLINATIMLLNHIGHYEKAGLIQNALNFTIEQGMHTADLYADNHSNAKLGTKEFTAEIIKNLGSKPENLAAAKTRYAKQEKSKDIDLTNYSLITKKRQLVGVDVYLDFKRKDFVGFSGKLNELTSTLQLNLQMISHKGLKIWPEFSYEHELSDMLVCRFLAKGEVKETEHQEIISLLDLLNKQGFTFVKTENLYLYDDKLGFSI